MLSRPPQNVRNNSATLDEDVVSAHDTRPIWRPEWRNWQTRWIQNPVRFTPREGSSPSFGNQQKPDSLCFTMTLSDCLTQRFSFRQYEPLVRSAVSAAMTIHQELFKSVAITHPRTKQQNPVIRSDDLSEDGWKFLPELMAMESAKHTMTS